MIDEAEGWLLALERGEALQLKPWERVQLLEHLASRSGDLVSVASELIDGPIPVWRLDDVYAAAVRAANEQIAIALLNAGATPRLLDDAAAAGMAVLCAALVERGTRVNRTLRGALAPIHHAALSPQPTATARVLAGALCDLTVRTPDGRLAWELGDGLAQVLKPLVGAAGPTWFREAQSGGIDHYLWVEEPLMFGFNPNDVQTPIWTGDETEGFGWANSPAQGRALLEDNGLLRLELAPFIPFIEKLEEGEDFSLADLPPAVRVEHRPAWR